ncbi:MAG: DUF3303 domain-containing protein [Thermomicrobiales bacterium]
MVVERFASGRQAEIYRIVRERGRMLPEGLGYVDSWVSADLTVCFQLMECADPVLFQEWTMRWGDLADFDIVPVVPSKATAALMARLAHEAAADPS